MKLKRLTALLISVAMTATILVGCGAKETAPAAESGTKEEASAEKGSDEAAPAAEEKTSY